MTVTATPNEGVSFINWTDAEGNAISTDATYTYVGTEDIELTANFGLSLTYSFPENGYMTVTVNGSTVSSGTILAPGTTIDVKLTPSSNYELESFTINGNDIVPNEDGTYSFTLTEATVINATFAIPSYTLTIITKGNGHVEVYPGYDEENDMLPTGDMINSGAKLPVYSADNPDNLNLLFLVFIPGNDDSLETAEVIIGNDLFQLELEDNSEFPNGAKYAFIPLEEINGDLTISASFSGEDQGLEEIGIDINNGPVEYYNLQGIRISSDNLTPGFYIIRQGSKAAKVLITK